MRLPFGLNSTLIVHDFITEKVSSDDEMEWAYSVNFISSLVFFLIALFTWISILRKTSSNIVLQTDDNWLNVIEKKNAQHDFEEKGSQDWCSWNRVILCRELASTIGQDPKSVVYPELFRSKDKFDVSKKVYTVSRGIDLEYIFLLLCQYEIFHLDFTFNFSGANVDVTTEKKEGRSKRQNIVEWKSLELESKEDERIFRPEVGLCCKNEKQITDAMVRINIVMNILSQMHVYISNE